MSSISLIQPDRDLFSWPQYWAACFGPAPFLPMSREEMDQLGWDSCDIILVTGDAYVDHPSFGMAICGRPDLISKMDTLLRVNEVGAVIFESLKLI